MTDGTGTGTGWRPRPVAAFALRTFVVLAPAVAGLITGLLLVRLVPPPAGPTAWFWWGGALAASWAAVVAAERGLRRFAPLVLLLKMGMSLPDKMPNRFHHALRHGRLDVDASGHDASVASHALDLVKRLQRHHRQTRGHSERVRALAVLIGAEMGLDEGDQQRIAWGALLHDLGKLEVPKEILDKDGRPDSSEWAILAGHPAAGAVLADPLNAWLGDAVHAVDGHHERWDGCGYPKQLDGPSIPLPARIVSVADSFETMTAVRSYKKPMTIEAAREEVADHAGGQFDPAVARAFLNIGVPRLALVAGPVALLAQIPLIGVVVQAGFAPAGAMSGALAAAAPWAGSAALAAGSLAAPIAATNLMEAGNDKATSIEEVEVSTARSDAAHPSVQEARHLRPADSTESSRPAAVAVTPPQADRDQDAEQAVEPDEPVADDDDRQPAVTTPSPPVTNSGNQGNGNPGNGNGNGNGNPGNGNPGNGNPGNGNPGNGNPGNGNPGNGNPGNGSPGNGSPGNGNGNGGKPAGLPGVVAVEAAGRT